VVFVVADVTGISNVDVVVILLALESGKYRYGDH
jgi:hypothetical protein